MELVKRVADFQIFHNFADVISERTKQANENRQSIKSETKLSDSVSAKIIMRNEGSE